MITIFLGGQIQLELRGQFQLELGGQFRLEKRGQHEADFPLEVFPLIKEIKGHRDYSPDKNNNGIIEVWEWLKECPSFDAEKEYKYLLK